MPGDHTNERSCAIRDVVARDLRGTSMQETTATGGRASSFARSLTCYPRPCSPGRVRPLPQTSPPPRALAMTHASAGGGRATPAVPQPPRYTVI
jgi:hypothetical protein